MADFFRIVARNRRGITEVYPKFIVGKRSDLMIRGKDFYAVWLEDLGLWSTDEQDVIDLIDRELDKHVAEHREEYGPNPRVMYMWDSETGMIDNWHKYCQKQQRDAYHMLDEKLIFSNMETKKTDYSSKRLDYPLEPGSIDAWNKLIGTLYSEEERHKIEWAIGSIVSGDSKKLQKFLVLYGEGGTGKSTILNVIQQLFNGYYAVFDAKALGSASNSFALEAFKTNPLVAIQHDGDLSKIEDNTRLNSLVSHEEMTINEKFKATYVNRFKCFLFMGTNKPVKITDGKSGIIRRLIDVHPTGNKLNIKEYRAVTKQVGFELGAIAYHCQQVYLEDPHAYDSYIPVAMFGASNDFYNFVIDSYHVFKKEDGTTLKAAWEMYKNYCDDAKVSYPYSQRIFKEELKNYFWDFNDRFNLEDGSRVRSYYSGFRTEKFETTTDNKKQEKHKSHLIEFNYTKSIFDKERADCFAQYATADEIPSTAWDKVETKLSDLDTSKVHYVRVPENHIVIDFDIKDKNGKKSFEKNVEEASKFPATYAELSKSGGGIHLHYIYQGDVTKLSRIYDDNIEVKVFTGKQSLRRRLTKCNNLPIATINSGLPLKGEKMINTDVVTSEKGIRTLIKRNLNKEYHAGTKPSVCFIHKILEDSYNDGVQYDVSDMKNAVFAFAANSTNHAPYCIKLVNEMHFKSDDISEPAADDSAEMVFYDVEVFPNLLLVNWKYAGEDRPVVRMINPTPTEIEGLVRHKLIGFNCRRYDNHIIYARLMGYDNEQLYNLSQKIIDKDKKGQTNAFFSNAYNLSYTDIYDFSAKKQSLKKWEIELGIHHQELGLPWDQPVPEDQWIKVAEYCDNDVLATEAVFNHLKGDWTARQILADLAGGSVNDTTNSLTTKIIFGNERKPKLVYTDLATGEQFYEGEMPESCAPKGIINAFPGYEYKMLDDNKPHNMYRGVDVGFGGYVYAEPGMYFNVALLDVASMHPNSAVNLNAFGEYTQRFKDILDARVAIKHGDFDAVKKMFGGKLAPYLNDESTASDLAQALKIAINSVYGLTSAGFDNPFRDSRNKNNIVALRGALFMKTLQDEIQSRGFTVAHIKTDSIKVANATPEIIQFVMDFGKKYGYTFEHEATYERMCLVNDAVYIAKYKDGKHAGEWTATGKQFAVPYVFKKLFSREPIEFDDLCETFAVSKGDLYLDKNERLAEDEHDYNFVGRVGRFCPIKPGCGGAILWRVSDGKYFAPPGTLKDPKKKIPYRWLESEMVQTLGKEADIDRSFYNDLVDKAVETISQYGDFEMFVSDDAPVFKTTNLNTPPWLVACGRETCEGCPEFTNDAYHMDCRLGHDIGDMIAMNKLNIKEEETI